MHLQQAQLSAGAHVQDIFCNYNLHQLTNTRNNINFYGKLLAQELLLKEP